MEKYAYLRKIAAVLAGGLVAIGGATNAASAQTIAGSHLSSKFDATHTTTATGPGARSFADGFAQTILRPKLSPIGANDWTCKPTPAHPTPVILVHGTWENAYANWSRLAPQLKKDGFCVFAPNLGRAEVWNKGGVGSLAPNTFGTGPVEVSAAQLSQVVSTVLRSTGARQVDLVGHSQGGLVARYYAKFGGGADPQHPQRNKIRKIITLGATNHGTTLNGMVQEKKTIDALGSVPGSAMGSVPESVRESAKFDTDRIKDWFGGAAGTQQERGNGFIKKLNAGGDTLPGIEYTAIATKYDQISTPYDATFLKPGKDAVVHNVTMQDGCAKDRSDHLGMAYSPRGIDLVRHALDPKLLNTDQIRCEANGLPLGSS